jgi:tripeptidyl-peptidase-1
MMLRLALLAAAAFGPTAAAVAGPGSEALAVRVGVRRTPASLRELERLFWAVATPGTPEYQQYLSPEQLRELTTAASADTTLVVAWLREAGCDDPVLAETGDAVTSARCPAPTPVAPAGLAEVVEFVHATTCATPLSARTTPRPVISSIDSDGRHRRLQQQPPRPNLGTPARQRDFYAIPQTQHSTNKSNLQMVWGCGTFGVNKTELGMFYERYCSDCDLNDVQYDTVHHGVEGGDNYMEGTLDTTYISSFGKGTPTLVSNTNTSMATEEGEGQGIATLVAFEEIARRRTVPLVLSLSLGSLAFDACDALCTSLAATTAFSHAQCHDYMQKQRQICLYASEAQQERINVAFKMMGLRGITVLGASGDGGPHWSFGPFSKREPIGAALNKVGCGQMSPLFPANSPYILAVGGITWKDNDPTQPAAWTVHEGCTGGGFSNEFSAPAFMAEAVAGYIKGAATIPGMAPASQYNASGRAYPDVAAFMDGVPLCFNGQCSRSICGGTSASTPTMAGILSLINDVRINKGLPSLGFVVPKIWQVAQDHPGEAFIGAQFDMCFRPFNSPTPLFDEDAPD